MKVRRTWRTAGALLLGLLAGGSAWAQSEGGDGADAAKPLIKPRTSEIMPRTPESLLLSITNTGKHLLAVGERGAVIVSNDGKNWAQVQIPTRATMTTVAFADPDHGWAAGHDAAIVHTEDGGRTWALQNFDPELEKPILALLALDAQHCIAIGAYGLMLETQDGGATWKDVDTHGFDEDELHLNSIAKLNNGDLFIAGEQGLMAISTDSGVTWQKLESPYDGSFFGSLPHGEKGAMAFGLRGNIYETDDARSGPWKQLDSGTVASMFGGKAMPDGSDVLVGLNGVIARVATDGTVTLLRSPAGTPLSDVVPYGDDQFIAVGESGIQPIAGKASGE
ncbi:WD40/YVTN/BNR-like repeat-containing protein [Solimonas marina]|uniref:Photosynthesis system II assembly factor Ycf48/Hcf136-like domain-containing protein n=1 Tax=Solimonas marina TaxID=2714601 RepID=A0A970B573_9GAMM|nr:YCF48-related protein [Solimonas marina]NKF21398.1 hypothetical protein [Solimonas marina]